LDVPTADDAANSESGASTGVEYYRTHNNNATGFRYLVWDGTNASSVRELPGYAADVANDFRLTNTDFSVNSSTVRNMGATSSEVFYGFRIYPGHYFFEQVNMSTSNVLSLRTFNDSDRSGDYDNPNSGQASNRNVRFWLGHKAGGGNDYDHTFGYQITMQDTSYASRFRVYIASYSSVSVQGTGSNSSIPTFRVNMLAYNKDSAYNSGQGYGDVSFNNSTYLLGSLLSWKVAVGGSTVVEKEVPELGPDDRLIYVLDHWTELP
jgi:hypothetical protein